MSPNDRLILDRQPVRPRWREELSRAGLASLAIVLGFWITVTAIVIVGRYCSGYHVGQYVAQPIHVRSDFTYFNPVKFAAAQQRARDVEPSVYRSTTFSWSQLEEQMKRWPDLAAGRLAGESADTFRGSLDAGAQQLLAGYQSTDKRPLYNQRVETFVASLRKWVLIPAEQTEEETSRQSRQWRSAVALRILDAEGHATLVAGPDDIRVVPLTPATQTEIAHVAADSFRDDLAPQLALAAGQALLPTHRLDPAATLEARDRAASVVLLREGEVGYKAGMVIKAPGEIDDRDLSLLQSEQRAYLSSLGSGVLVRDLLGQAGVAAVITVVLCSYVRRYQPRIHRNHARGAALATLLVGMLLVALLAASGTRPLYIFGVAPPILAAMIIAIAYEPRFGLGVSVLLSLLTTLALNQGLPFLLVPLSGCACACAFGGTVRTRGRLIEIGFLTGLAMAAMTMFTGVWASGGAIPFSYICNNAAYAGIAGLGSGFVVLGVLPFIERAFRITTGMTLLELSDSSHPLQRKLAAEAPGTYSHCLQVATLAETAAEAIGADALLTRVGALYHDIGKTHRSHYFCENQSHGDNAHMRLSPEVSFMIIVEHIKDGVELAKQNNFPTNLYPFIQQHHGTTLVEFFYHEACKLARQRGGRAEVSQSLFRYPGPKPRSREIAIVMLADACESASRAMEDPTPEAIDKLVHDLTLKRLLDEQFAECDMTLHELNVVEKTLAKTLQSLNHGRIAYPDAQPQAPAAQATMGM